MAFASPVTAEFGLSGGFEDGAFNMGATNVSNSKKGRSIFQRDALFDDDDDDDGWGGVAVGEGVEASTGELSGTDDVIKSDSSSSENGGWWDGAAAAYRLLGGDLGAMSVDPRGAHGHSFVVARGTGPVAEAVASSGESRLTSAPSSAD